MTIASPTLQDFDPELAQAMRAEAMRQEDHAELIASENYASPLVMAVQDSVFTNKYAEGYPPPLLQRLRARGRGRTPGAGAGQGAVRLRLRQRPAACRRPGQRGRVPGADAARRHRHGHESGAGRPPDPWQSVQFLGPALSHRALRPGSRDRADRLRRDGAYRAAHPAQDADRRFLRLLAPQDWARMRHRRPGRRGVLGGHGARGRTGRCGRVSQPAAARARGHQHHAQDAARPRGGIILARGRTRTSAGSSIPPSSPASRAGR